MLRHVFMVPLFCVLQLWRVDGSNTQGMDIILALYTVCQSTHQAPIMMDVDVG